MFNQLRQSTNTLRLGGLRSGRAFLNAQHKNIYTTAPLLNTAAKPDHTTDTYSKEVDATPAEDKNVHRVDPNSDVVQKPYEQPSGWSREGVKSEEYRSGAGAGHPYAPGKGVQGARNTLAGDNGPEASGREKAPDAKSSLGKA